MVIRTSNNLVGTYLVSQFHGGKVLLTRLNIQTKMEATKEMVFMTMANSWTAKITGVAAADPRWVAILLLNNCKVKN